MKLPSKVRVASVIIILVTYFVVIGIFYPNISRTYSDITKPLQPRTFQIPIFINSNGTVGFTNGTDIEIGLSITYPNGTLVINEPVDLTVTVVLKGEAITKIQQIDFTFQNWLTYPATSDTEGIAQQGTIVFSNNFPNSPYYPYGNSTPPSNANYISTGHSTVYWSVDGDYKPVFELFFFDGTNSPLTTVDSVVLHVYPQEQLTQIETNQASINLSVVVLIFSTVGIIALVVQIWDHTETECKYKMLQ